MDKNKKSKKPASFSLIIVGVVSISLWLLSAKPWEGSSNNGLLFFLDEVNSSILLPILIIGIYILGLGLMRLLHASWDKGNKVSKTNSNIKK